MIERFISKKMKKELREQSKINYTAIKRMNNQNNLPSLVSKQLQNRKDKKMEEKTQSKIKFNWKSSNPKNSLQSSKNKIVMSKILMMMKTQIIITNKINQSSRKKPQNKKRKDKNKSKLRLQNKRWGTKGN